MKPTPITFLPGAVDQTKSTRALPLGGLTDAQNLTVTVDKGPTKRPGLSRTAPTTDSGTVGTIQDGVHVAGCDMLRDSKGQYYAYDPSANQLILQGNQFKSPMPSLVGTVEGVDGVMATNSIQVGNNIFTWSVADLFSSGTSRVVYQISQGTTGTALAGLGSIPISGVLQASAAYDSSGGFIWLFTHDGTNIVSRKISPTTGSVVAGPTTYVTASGGRAISGLHAERDATAGVIHVVWQEFAAASIAHGVSRLDTATGAPSGSPAALLTTAVITGTNINTSCGIRILKHTGANGKLYYALWRASPAASPALQLLLVQITVSSLALDAETVLQTITTGINNDAEIRGVCSGYVDSGGTRVVLNQYSFNDTTTTLTDNYYTWNYQIDKTTWDGATATTTVFAEGSWLGSDPSQVTGDSTGEWYVLTGFEDGREGLGQRTLFLRNSSGLIVSQGLTHGQAPPLWQMETPILNGSATAQIGQHHCTVTCLTSPTTSKLIHGVGKATDTITAFKQAIMTWDFNPTVGPPVAFGAGAIFPGGLPVFVGPRDYIREATPMLFPSYVSVLVAGAGAAVGDIVVGVVYRYVHSDGKITRSAPLTLAITGAKVDTTILFPALRHRMTPFGNTAQYEVYCSRPGSTTPTLQYVVKASVFAGNAVPITPYFNAATAATTGIVVGVPLYTTGGGLANSPMPSCRALTKWRDRIVAVGTPEDGEIWYTQEFEEGDGPRFNAAALRVFWFDGSGPIYAAGVISWDHLALFRSKEVGVLSGPGPDSLGQNGAYIAETLQGNRGCERPKSVYESPDGCGFQDKQSGRMCMVTPAGQILENNQGIDFYRTLTITSAQYFESVGQTWLGNSDGYYFVQDHRFPVKSEDGALRQWFTWFSSALNTPVVLSDSAEGPRAWEGSGVFRMQRASTYTDQTASSETQFFEMVQTGQISPFGRHGSGMIDSVIVQAIYLAAHTLKITVTPILDDGSTGTSSVHTVVASNPGTWAVEPSGCLHVTGVILRIEETASTTAGFALQAITMNVKPDSTTRLLGTSQKVSPA